MLAAVTEKAMSLTQRRLAAKERECQMLREAIKPFARYAQMIDKRDGGVTPSGTFVGIRDLPVPGCDLAELRACLVAYNYIG